ncbi:hypothetical protein IVB12_30630 [Bradyrhizobium sp. 179]|uniref:hypothetical protein n=1 Tax=Bradyrhizobium sp. 179 TaxID=2782648 RepID=UPI001FFB5F90|nr:hypothetical protein [Bradyrhizobium sp. 179]MCK1546179.1 hypothetical protein [Bradyrhizobium sp. 179]
MPESEEWSSVWVPALHAIGMAISKSTGSAAALEFLDYPLVAATAGTFSTRDNIFRHPAAGPAVKIRVGSTHSVKGETHTATLVLDTFYSKHSLVALKPWLLGQKSGGAGPGVRDLTRLKQHYVAMTRPTHLLCLAISGSAFSAAELGILVKRHPELPPLRHEELPPPSRL